MVDNPRAFPMEGKFSFEKGMTLRDYFAGQVIAARFSNPAAYPDSVKTREIEAMGAYAIADAMLAERKKGPQ
jgi:hypothetical protein